MPKRLPLSIAYNAYDRNAAISDGRVVPDGIEPNVVIVPLAELFAGMITTPTFDVSELSLSSYTVARARGDRRLIAIPIFLSRAFRSNSIYVNSGSGINRADQLNGKRIGVPMYQQTAGVWARGMLQDEYGLNLDSVTWVGGALATMNGGERTPIALPDHVRLERLPADRTLESALIDGEIDAIVSPMVPPVFRQAGTPIRRLFPDFPERDRAYYNKTGLFPLMHVIVIRSEVYESNPWVAKSLYDAFSKAKQIAVKNQADVSYLQFALPFVAGLLDEQLEIFGSDPWPYGFENNKSTLDTFMRYMQEQGLLEHPMTPEELFAPTTLALT